MKSSFSSRLLLASGVLALAASKTARAELVLYDKNDWSVYTTGRVEGHYQLMLGDGDPVSHNRLVGGQIQNTVTQDEKNRLVDSRIRSGFVGTQLGFGIRNQLWTGLTAEAFIGAWLAGIDSSKGTPPAQKGFDVREGWGAVNGRFGRFVFGRAFSIFGSASGEVNNYAFAYAVGHPCLADVSTIACGSVGAGPLYAGFNAQLRYETPRLAGVQLQLSIEDPSSLPDFHITRWPRAEGELGYELELGTGGLLSVKGQGLVQQLGKLNANRDGTETVTAWGALGAVRFELGGFKIGGGAWTGKGLGTHNALQQDDQAKPLAHDLPGGAYPGDELRSFRGYFGNVVYGYNGVSAAVGGGGAFVQETVSDAAAISTSLLRQNLEYHAVLTWRVKSLVFSAEYMHWMSDWYLGESQTLDFVGAGATFEW
ncbi:MAG TPA: porin [Polyangiaceae bacterium]|nr:porin [Polyangiaceae bacterium]